MQTERQQIGNTRNSPQLRQQGLRLEAQPINQNDLGLQRAIEETNRQSLLEVVQHVNQELSELLREFDSVQVKRYYTCRAYWIISHSLEVLSLTVWHSVEQHEQTKVKELLTQLRYGSAEVRYNIVRELRREGYFSLPLTAQNSRFQSYFIKFDEIIRKRFFDIFRYILDHDYAKILYNQEMMYIAFDQSAALRFDDQVTRSYEVLQKIVNKYNEIPELERTPVKEQQAAVAQTLMQNELAAVVWVQGGFDNLTSIDVEDFYQSFKKLLQGVFGITIVDGLHRAKIVYYIDSEQGTKLEAQNLCDFFELCWANPLDQSTILSRNPFGAAAAATATQSSASQSEPQQNSGGKQHSQQLEVMLVQTTQQDELNRKGSQWLLDARGYSKGVNYGNGIVRFGRKAAQSLVLNDIYFGTRSTMVSRRQFSIMHNRARGFRICDTSTSNPLGVIVKRAIPSRLMEDRLLGIGTQITLRVVEIQQEQELEDSDADEEQEQMQFSTLSVRRTLKNNLMDASQKPERSQNMTIAFQQQAEAQRNTLSAVQNGAEPHIINRTIINPMDERNVRVNRGRGIPVEDRLTLAFKEMEQNMQEIRPNEAYGAYAGVSIKLEVFYNSKHKEGKGQSMLFRGYENKNVFTIGRAQNADWSFGAHNGDGLEDIHAQIIYEKGRWWVKAANDCQFSEDPNVPPRGLVYITLKTWREVESTRPSKNYTIKDDTLIYFGGNALRLRYLQRPQDSALQTVVPVAAAAHDVHRNQDQMEEEKINK